TGDGRVPVRGIDGGLVRDLAPLRRDRDGRAEVRAAPAEVRVPALLRRVRRPLGPGVAWDDVLGGLLEDRAGLVGAQDVVRRALERGTDHEAGAARRPARVDRARRADHRYRALAPILGGVGAAEVAGRGDLGAER